MKNVWSPGELIAHARAHSGFFRDLYAGLADGESRLERLPLYAQDAFWEANRYPATPGLNRVLTGELVDGLVFKSGGTTGNPKFSFFTRAEWTAFTEIFGAGMSRAAVSPGDRVANLFYAGDLYASFLFIHGSLERATANSVIYPIGGGAAPATLLHAIEDLRIDSLAGVPTTLVSFAEEISRLNGRAPRLKRILFGGEALYPDQEAFLKTVFPGVECRSIGYASVDAGLLGYASEDCGPGEHRCFGAATRMEILDEATDEVIEETGKTGRLLVTNLTRRLMPIIRYPAGDRAQWVDPPGTPDRKFLLLGRSEEAARIGPVSLYYEDMRAFLAPWSVRAGIHGFQLRVTHEQQRDTLTLVLGHADPAAAAHWTRQILAALSRERPMLDELIRGGKINPARVEWVNHGNLDKNPRTGKLKRVIDLRR